MYHRSATEELIQSVLGQDYVHLEAEGYEISEKLGDSACSVGVSLHRRDPGERTEQISGAGVGFVDALYHGLIDHYAREYPSLKTITFTGFEVKGNMGTSEERGADAECVVTLVVQNSHGREFRFEDRGRSLVAAALSVVVESAEYFINSEKAYITVFNARTDAKLRNRPDLIQKYTANLAELVKTTSYSEVIERAEKSQ